MGCGMPLTQRTVNLSLLNVDKLSVSFQLQGSVVDAVKDLSFDLTAGESLGIVGESGSGKTQAVLSLLGLLSKNGSSRGAAAFKGQDLLGRSERDMRAVRGQQIAMVFQDPMTSLNPYLKVGTQLAEVLVHHQGLNRSQAWSRGVEALEQVGIDRAAQRARQYPHELSGGMRQRVAIAMAILCEPDILIADEPTTALDVTVQQGILSLLDRLRHELKTALIFISHDLAVVSQLCERVLVLRHGQLVESGETRGVFSRPQTTYSQALLAAVPRLDVTPPSPVPDAGKATPVLAVKDLSVVYRSRGRQSIDRHTRAVDKVSFEIKAGETLGVVGESGSGKSSLARGILGLIPVHEGEVKLSGQSLLGLTKSQRRAFCKDVQMIFQDPLSSLNPRLTVAKLLAEPLRTHFSELDQATIESRVSDSLEQVGLSSREMNRYPHQLSGGQCQRVGIARAIIMTPKLIVCDEPVSALDVSVQAKVIELLKTLQQRLSLTYLFIAHDISVVKSISQNMLVMQRGKVVEAGDSETVCSYPKHEYTRALIQAVPKLVTT